MKSKTAEAKDQTRKPGGKQKKPQPPVQEQLVGKKVHPAI